MTTLKPLEERFWSKVAKAGPEECWPWTGALRGNGYARIMVHEAGKRPMKYVHRIAYEILVGPIPLGKQIDHLCRNRAKDFREHLQGEDDAAPQAQGDAAISCAGCSETPRGCPTPEECKEVRRAYQGDAATQKEVERLATWLENVAAGYDPVGPEYNNAARMLRRLAAQQAGRSPAPDSSAWISVKDRVPATDTGIWSRQVLALWDSGVMSVEACIIYSDCRISWSEAPGVTAKITHWRNLPEVPRLRTS